MAPSGIYTSEFLSGVVRNLKTPETFLLNRGFPRVVTEDSEEIHFDVAPDKRRLAPFVAPQLEGKIVEVQGYNTQTFKPAYIKDKRALDPARNLKRALGEAIGGTLSPQQRQQLLLAQELEDQMWMLQRRFEVMACEALRTGKQTITGDGYPTVVVDFGRKATLTKALTVGGGTAWGEAGVSPVDDIEDWCQEVLQESGMAPTDVVLERDAVKYLRADSKFKDAVDTRRGGTSTIQLGPMIEKQAVLLGMLGNLRIWMYQDWYVDENDTEQPLLPQYQVLILSEAIEGVRHYGAIRDEEAGFQAVPWWPKSWVEKDPSVRYLLMQSAPLMVPYRPNASMGVLVHD